MAITVVCAGASSGTWPIVELQSRRLIEQKMTCVHVSILPIVKLFFCFFSALSFNCDKPRTSQNSVIAK